MSLPHFVLLYVDEPEKSAAFYARLLDRQPLDSAPNFVMFELSPGLRLGLWARRDVEPAPRGASDMSDMGELAMAVGSREEVEKLCADRRRKGATILQEPVKKDFGLTFLAADPDGHRLRVFCPAP
ncbi:MAG TPA: VOC family protein [Roseiarcus sp.]|nr:VOC family protein [Roseiarcus sp.]